MLELRFSSWISISMRRILADQGLARRRAALQRNLSGAADVDGTGKNFIDSCGAWKPIEFSEHEVDHELPAAMAVASDGELLGGVALFLLA